MAQTQMTNIVYLTTKCNLDCNYCYEAVKRKSDGFEHFNVSNEAIDEFIEELELREGECPQSTLVIMGGEPTLAMPQLKYLIDGLVASAKKLGKDYYAKYTTNGLMLNNDKFYKNFFETLNDAASRGFQIGLEVSYDGAGNSNRELCNGKDSTWIVEKVLDKLTRDRVEFCISYTVHEKNYEHLIQDAIRFCEKYPTLKRMSFSIAYTRLDETKQGLGFTVQKEYTKYMREIYGVYGKPICAFCCGACKECDKGNYTGNRYLSPTKGIMTAEKRTEKEFDQF